MPELPEVEATRLSFADRIRGARVLDLRMGKPLRWPLGCDPAGLRGRQVQSVLRRGKYLWLALDEGGLLIHLGMSGSLAFAGQMAPPGTHDHADLHTSQGILRLHDPRRFGAVVWGASLSDGVVGRLLAGLGREPFDPGLTPQWLRAQWRGRRAPVKAALLAGDVVVGAGNIYACEALHAAGIDPRTPAGRLGLLRCERLLTAVRATLQAALDVGGSTLRDYRNAHGDSGRFQLQAQVYGRAGEPCRRCTRPIRLIRQGQRSTYYCAGCQKP